MEKLTCNQTIILLQISRGTLRQEEYIGTYLSDLRLLERLNYIIPEDNKDGFKLTQHGEDRIEFIKMCPPEDPNPMLVETIKLIRYFVDRVEAGTIRSKTIYNMYKKFLENI